MPNPVFYYGLDVPVGEQKETEISDARHCIRCGTAYEYRYYTYAHLGGFCCPNCGYSRHDADVSVTQINSVSPAGSEVRMKWRGSEKDAAISLPAVFNIYNAAAAVCAGIVSSPCDVTMDGGTLGITVDAQSRDLMMSGPARTVFEGSVEI